MKTLDLIQGSELWHAVRLQHFTASEAPAMMGASKYQTRDELLKLKATGIAKEVDTHTQRLFNKGHETEASIRPFIEHILGDELYPVTGSIEIEGLKLLGSFDGLTMMEDKGFEHKLWNEELAASVRAENLHPHYFWQLEQLLLISGAEYMLFATSNGTGEQCVWMKYYPVAGRREELIAGWKQFAADLATYVAPEAEAPKAIAEPVETLPAITYSTEFKSTGLELRSNIEAFKAAALRLVDQSKKQLETDQDFANAEARIKSCKSAEERIAAIQSNVVGEVSDIDKFVKDLGAIAEMLRQCRLNEDKQVKARKEAIKLEEITRASNEWNAVIVGYNEKLWKSAKVQMPIVHVDFQGAIKGLKTVASLRSKLNDEIARGKIEAAKIYENIITNLQLLNMIAGEYMELFADLQMICVKDADYIKAIAKQRVDEHKAAEQKRIHEEAQRIANEQIEKDRQAESARAQAAALEAVKPLEAKVAPLREEKATLLEAPQSEEVPAEYEQYATQAAEHCPSHEPQLSDYHRGHIDGKQEGIIAGLDLAIAIFMKHGEKGFVKAVEDFIEVGSQQNETKAA